MGEQRDPRKDPQAGDWTVMRRGTRADWHRLVVARDDNTVIFKDEMGAVLALAIRKWQDQTENDEVIHVAE